MKAAQAQLAKIPKEQKDQQEPVKEKINQAGGTAVTELSAALGLMKPEDNNRPIVLSRLGEAYESMNKWQEASDTYQKSIALKPDDAKLYSDYGRALAENGKAAEARAKTKRAAELDPSKAGATYYNLGAALVNNNRGDDAIAAFRDSIAADPNYANSYYQYGTALVAKATSGPGGKLIAPPGMREALQKYLQLAPTGPFSDQAKQLLQAFQ